MSKVGEVLAESVPKLLASTPLKWRNWKKWTLEDGNAHAASLA